jgi:hypothetical protein
MFTLYAHFGCEQREDKHIETVLAENLENNT